MRMPWVVLLVACGTPAPATHDLPKPAVVAETTPPPIDAHVVDAPPPDAYVEPEPYEQKAAADRARADNLEKFPKPDIKPFGTPGDKARGIELLAAARKTKTDAIAAYRAVVDADPSNVDAYYELASAYARAGTTDIAIPLLGRLAVARHCDECSLVVAAAVHDDAWRTQWATEGFRDVLAAYATTPEGPHDPPDPAAPPVDPYVEAMQDHVTCAKGSRIKSKGDLSPGGTGEQWCERNRLKDGPYYQHIDGCSMGEGGCTISGTYRDGKRDGLWHSSGRYEDTIVGAYHRDKKHGLWTDEAKSRMTYQIYVDDKLEDLSIVYAADGKPVKEAHYHAGLLDGHYVEYQTSAPFGPSVDGAYAAGKKDGHWSYFRDDGTKLKEESWDRGAPEGTFTYYDEKHAVLATRTFVHGTGPWIEYDADATVIATGAYLNGTKDGVWTERLDSGPYKDGKRTGTWNHVDASGAKIAEGTYGNGLRNGAWTFWRADGTLLATGTYAAGKRAATWRIFDDAGTEVVQRLGFRNGKLSTVNGAPSKRGHRDFLVLASFDDAPVFIEDREGLPFGGTSD